MHTKWRESLKTFTSHHKKCTRGKSDRTNTNTPARVSPSRMEENGSRVTETLYKAVTWLARLSPTTVSVLVMEPSLTSVCVTCQENTPHLTLQGSRVELRMNRYALSHHLVNSGTRVGRFSETPVIPLIRTHFVIS